MEQKKLIEKLKEVIEANNLKKSEVEEKIGFPKNGLSNIISGRKEIPAKWLAPFSDYIDSFSGEAIKLGDGLTSAKQISEKIEGVKIASEVPPPQKEKWVIEIEKFCNEHNCTYQDLMSAYMNIRSTPKVKKQIAEYVHPPKNPTSDWFRDYRNKKLGLK